jgi:hypothetical protein
MPLSSIGNQNTTSLNGSLPEAESDSRESSLKKKVESDLRLETSQDTKHSISRRTLLKVIKNLREMLEVKDNELSMRKEKEENATQVLNQTLIEFEKMKVLLQSSILDRNNVIDALFNQTNELQTSLNLAEGALECLNTDSQIRYESLIESSRRAKDEMLMLLKTKDEEISALRSSRDYYKNLFESECKLYNESVESSLALKIQVETLNHQLVNATATQKAHITKSRILKIVFIGLAALVVSIFGR